MSLEDLSKALSGNFQNSMANMPTFQAPPTGNNFVLPDLQTSIPWMNQVNAKVAADNAALSANPHVLDVTGGTPAAQSTNALHEGLLGFLGNVLGHTVGPVWNDVRGAMSGFNGYQNVPQSFQNFGPWGGALFGALHPGQAEQADAQTMQQRLNPNGTWGAGLQHVLANTADAVQTSPLSLIPTTWIAKPIGAVAKATGITPSAQFLWDWARGAIRTPVGPATAAVEDMLKGAENVVPKAPMPIAPLGKFTQPSVSADGMLNIARQPTDITSALEQFKQAKIPLPMPSGVNKLSDLTPLDLVKAGVTSNVPGNLQNLLHIGASDAMKLQDALKAGTLPDEMLGQGAVGLNNIHPDVLKSIFNTTGTPVAQGVKDALDAAPKPFNPEQGLTPVTSVKTNLETPFGIASMKGMTSVADTSTAKNALADASKYPYALNEWQHAVGSGFANWVISHPEWTQGSQFVQNLIKLFSRMPGTTKAFQSLFGAFFGQKSSFYNETNNRLVKALEGTTKEEREKAIRLMEPTKPGTDLGDPTSNRIARNLEEVDQWIKSELAKRPGILTSELNPVKFGVGRYIPHITKQVDDAGNTVSDLGTFLRTNIDANKTRDLKGTINELNQKAFASGGKTPEFETDPLNIYAHYLHQATDAMAAYDFRRAAIAAGEKSLPSARLGEVAVNHETGSTLVPYAHPQTGERAFLTQEEAKVLQGLEEKQPDTFFSKWFRRATNNVYRSMFWANPFLHIVNNLGFQIAMHNPSAIKDVFKYMPEAWHGVQSGSDMDRALKAGALNLSSEIGSRFASQDKQISQIEQAINGKQNLLIRAAKKYNSLTPDMEKAYRTSVFMNKVNEGMTDAQAADYVRSIFGGHMAPGLASPAEKFVGTYLMPFVNWTKTALVSNAKNAMRNPLPYSAIANSANETNREATGHGMLDNPNPASIAIPNWKDSKGNQQYIEPYFPAWDLVKLGKDIAQSGIFRGSEEFGIGRTNPFVKGLMGILGDVKNPGAAFPSLVPLLKKSNLPATAPVNQVPIFWGDKGPIVEPLSNPYVSAFTQNMTLLPGMQMATDLGQGKQTGDMSQFRNDLLQWLTSGFISAPDQTKLAKSARSKASAMRSSIKANNAAILQQQSQPSLPQDLANIFR